MSWVGFEVVGVISHWGLGSIETFFAFWRGNWEAGSTLSAIED